MPLGLARDSMLDLTELANNHDNYKTIPSYHHAQQKQQDARFDYYDQQQQQQQPQEVLLQNPALAMTHHNHSTTMQSQVPVKMMYTTGTITHTSVVSASHNAILQHDPLPDLDNSNNIDPYAGFTMDYYEDEDYYMEDPYAPSYEEFGRRTTTTKKKNAFCCFLVPWNSTPPQEQPPPQQQQQQQSTQHEQETSQPPPPPPSEPNSVPIIPKQVSTTPPRHEETKEHVPSPPESPTRMPEEDDEDVTEEEEKRHDEAHHRDTDGDTDDDNVSTGSDLLGEKLSDKDRLAVLARLRLTDRSDQDENETQRLFVTTSTSTTSLSSSSSTNKKQKQTLPVAEIVTAAPNTISTLPSTTTATTTSASSSPKTMEMEHEEAAPSLPSPTSTTDTSNVEEEKEELPPPAPLKGILKRSIHKSVDSLTNSLTNHASSSSGSLDSKAGADSATTAAAAAAASRRMLFPSVEDDRYPSQTSSSDPQNPSKQKKKTQFAPMARVIAVASRKDMLFIEKSLVWWQKSDYNDFKKTGRIIAKAMMEGGSEIWLTTSSTTNTWGRRISSGGRRKTSLSRENVNNPAVTSTKTNKNTNTDTSSSEEGEDDDIDSFGNKWWCKFGHSRRGLEHIASMEEGRERQRNVNASIAAVMKEQQRQRMSGKDVYKLATSGRTYTSWARDLALAAGAADAEAVRANFDTNAKNRAHYLQQRSRGTNNNNNNNNNNNSMNNNTRKFPTFFMDMSDIAANVLDANTSSSMLLKKKQQKQKQEDKPVPIHNDPDPGSINTTKRISKKAAGFGHGEGSVDMAAVLTGMGPASRTRVEAQ